MSRFAGEFFLFEKVSDLAFHSFYRTEGPTKRFEASVKKAQAAACTGQLSTFTYQLCEVRLLKLSVGRYTWTPSLLLDLCNQTLPFFNAGQNISFLH